MTADDAELSEPRKAHSWVSKGVRRAPQNREGMSSGGRLDRCPEKEGEPPARSIVLSVTGPGRAEVRVADALTVLNRKRIFEFAAAKRLPAIYEYDFLVRDGGLMSYGPDLTESLERTAALVDRIFKGARPGELPFERPIRYPFVFNLKTAKSTGLEVPPKLLALADEVIE